MTSEWIEFEFNCNGQIEVVQLLPDMQIDIDDTCREPIPPAIGGDGFPECEWLLPRYDQAPYLPPVFFDIVFDETADEVFDFLERHGSTFFGSGKLPGQNLGEVVFISTINPDQLLRICREIRDGIRPPFG